MALEVLATAKSVVDALKLAREVRAGLDPSTQAASETAHFGLLLDLWGAILFETRENCERARSLARRAEEGNWYGFGTFTFQVTDAMLPEFCRLAPAPRMLTPTARLIGRLRRIDVFQRAGAAAPDFRDDAPGPHHRVASGFAKDFLLKGGIGEFNEILEVATSVARAEYVKDPSQPLGFLLPDPIDESVAPDEELL